MVLQNADRGLEIHDQVSGAGKDTPLREIAERLPNSAEDPPRLFSGNCFTASRKTEGSDLRMRGERGDKGAAMLFFLNHSEPAVEYPEEIFPEMHRW
jgi:hypothetical protein